MTLLPILQAALLALALTATATCITNIIQMFLLCILNAGKETMGKTKCSFNFTLSVAAWVMFFVTMRWGG